MLDRLRVMKRPKLGVFKFTSCDGCQLSLLDCEEELLDLAGAIDIAYFMEAKREFDPGPFDVVLVEGSVSTPEEKERTRRIRESSKVFVSFGACATAGGVQALRNFGDVDLMKSAVYQYPQNFDILPTSTPHSQHVKVDFELHGCPPNRHQLLEILGQMLLGRKPRVPSHSVCLECKRKGNICVLVARELPCMGPVTHDGCGALCPSYDRACYGCFGPMDDPHVDRFGRELEERGLSAEEIVRRFRQVTPGKEAFARAGNRYAGKEG